LSRDPQPDELVSVRCQRCAGWRQFDRRVAAAEPLEALWGLVTSLVGGVSRMTEIGSGVAMAKPRLVGHFTLF
jgi:hypothetical protein